jgi:hypothetical protein
MRKENISLEESFQPLSSEQYSFTSFEELEGFEGKEETESKNLEERFEEDLDA